MQADGTGKVVTNDENPMNHVTVWKASSYSSRFFKYLAP